jgi:hypothetical protein
MRLRGGLRDKRRGEGGKVHFEVEIQMTFCPNIAYLPRVYFYRTFSLLDASTPNTRQYNLS